MRIDTFASHLSEPEATEIARSVWGLTGTLHRLPGEYDDNFRLILPDGSERVLKVMHPEREASFVDLQAAALAHIERTNPALDLPRVVPTSTGANWTQVEAAGGARLAWMLGWVAGRPLAEVGRTPELLMSVGRLLGRAGVALADFEHVGLDRELRWDLMRARWIRERLEEFEDLARRALVERTIARFDAEAAPVLSLLPKVAIHGDANDWNVLVRGGRGRAPEAVSLIDFGDMVRSPRICDLAIGAAYAMFDAPDPLAALAQVAAGYAQVAPPTESEVEILAPLVAMRLAVSVTNAAIRRALAPDDAYVSVSEAPAWATLEALERLPPRLVCATLRHACGFTPLPAVGRPREVPAPILAPPLLDHLARVRPLDLSVGSLLLGADPGNLEPAGLCALIERELGAGDAAELGFGIYGEARLLGPIPPEPGEEPATIQLGAELFLPAGSVIYAPFVGVVAEILATAGRARALIAHTEGESFHTLWLGLDTGSLPVVGTALERGAPIGRVATPEGNGGWPPHVRLQLLVDDLGLGARFPTAARPSERAVWQAFSPDPTALLGVPTERLPAPRSSFDEILAARRTRIGRNLSLSYRRPLEIVRGFRQHLFDANGRAYLDVYNNVAHVGHQHPRVVAAIRAQVGLLNTNTRYLHPNLVRYAERLTAKMPASLSVVYVVNSASEANELALRLARVATGGRDLIVLEAAYHGHTTSLIDASPYKHDGPGGAGPPDWVHTAPIPDDYRGAWKRGNPQAGENFAQPVGQIAARLAREGKRATFLAESLPSVGGQIVPPPGYLAAVYRAMRSHGGLVIADEVQTGFGRLGHAFWGFELLGVVPDIVVLGKPIGNGHPLGAVVTTPEIAAAFDNGMEFFSTFGGNPVSSAAGLAVFDVVEDEGLQENARRLGDRLLTDLRALTSRHEIAGDARGVGLFLGLELVRDRETLEPAAAEAAYAVDRLRDLGILAGTDGPHHNVIKLRPGMIFEDADADRLIAGLDRVLGEVALGY